MESKYKFRPITGREGPERDWGIALLFVYLRRKLGVNQSLAVLSLG